MDKELETIIINKKFTNFWELFDFLKLASYNETESIVYASDYFKGNIWGDVISANIRNAGFKPVTTTIRNGGPLAVIERPNLYVVTNVDGDVAYENGDQISTNIYIMTENANRNLIEIYKAYVETLKYETINKIENHIKCLNVTLTTELGMTFFKNGIKRFKND